MIKHEFAIEYTFGSKNPDGEEFWEDEPNTGRYTFDADDLEGKGLAIAAARAHMAYLDYVEFMETEDDEEPFVKHRIVYRLTSDEVV